MGTLSDFVMSHPLFDGHEHLKTPRELAESGLSLNEMAGYALADLAVVRGPQPAAAVDEPSPDAPDYPRHFFSAWALARNTGYCRAVERACRDLFGLDFTLENWPALRERIARTLADAAEQWYVETLRDRAGIKWVVKDHISVPQEAAAGVYPDFVRFNYRDDDLLCLPDRHEVLAREERWNRSIHTLDDLVEGLMQSITDCLATGRVTSFKIGVAYRRSLAFGNPTHDEAERAFDRLMSFRHGETHFRRESERVIWHTRLSSRQLRPLHDYLVHRFVRRADDEGLTVQIHTGYLAGVWNELGNVDPLQLTPLFRRYPTVRFDLFHAGWPYHDLMAALGKHYPNVWINLCWAWAMNPIAMEEALDAFLDAVPLNKVVAFGADTGTPFTSYAYALQAREGVARVLERRVERGAMDEELALSAARAILLENGERLHALGTSSG